MLFVYCIIHTQYHNIVYCVQCTWCGYTYNCMMAHAVAHVHPQTFHQIESATMNCADRTLITRVLLYGLRTAPSSFQPPTHPSSCRPASTISRLVIANYVCYSRLKFVFECVVRNWIFRFCAEERYKGTDDNNKEHCIYTSADRSCFVCEQNISKCEITTIPAPYDTMVADVLVLGLRSN